MSRKSCPGFEPSGDDIDNPVGEGITQLVQGGESFVEAGVEEVKVVLRRRRQRRNHQLVHDERFLAGQSRDVHEQADEAADQLVLGQELGLLFDLVRPAGGRGQNQAALIGG